MHIRSEGGDVSFGQEESTADSFLSKILPE